MTSERVNSESDRGRWRSGASGSRVLGFAGVGVCKCWGSQVLGFADVGVRKLTPTYVYYRDREMSFAELTVSVQGWVNHVRYADTWGLREHVFASHPVLRTGPSPDPSPPRGEGSRAGGTE